MRVLERLRNPASIAHPLVLIAILALAVRPIWHRHVIHAWPMVLHVTLCALLLGLGDRKLPRLGCLVIGAMLGLQLLQTNGPIYWIPAALVLSVLTPASQTGRYPSRAESGLALLAGAAVAAVALQLLLLFMVGELEGFLQAWLAADESSYLRLNVVLLVVALGGLLAQAIHEWKAAPIERHALRVVYLAGALAALLLNPASLASIPSSLALWAIFVLLYSLVRRTARPEPRLAVLPDTDRHLRWYDSIIARSQFPRVKNVEGEYWRLNVLRIAVGLIALWRTLRIAYVEYYGGASIYDWPLAWIDPFPAVAVQCVLLVCFTIGLQTPLVAVLLAPASIWLDLHLRTYTLGTNMLVLLLLTLLMAGAGRRLSLDAWSMRMFADGWWGRWNRRLYGGLERNARELTCIYFLLFLGYAFTSFGAVLFHISDVYWVQGRTIQVLFTNSYLSRFYELWRVVERATPQGFWWLSSATLVMQTIFQLFMIPLMFFRNGRRFVVFWGWGFAIASAVFLQLSYLPWLEICLWYLLFSRPTPALVAEVAPLARGAERRPKFGFGLAVTAWSLLLVLFALKFPHVERYSRALGLPMTPIRRVTLYCGLDVPIVFNREDLTLGDAWPVIHRLTPAGEPRILPLNGIEGERLWYHLSDCCYFGNSLKWRRAATDQDLIAFNDPEALGYELVTRIIDFDYRRHAFESPVEYAVTIFRTRSSDVAVSDPQVRYARELVLQYVLRRDPDGTFCRTGNQPPRLDISGLQRGERHPILADEALVARGQ